MRETHGVVLSEGETVIREYEASYIENPKTEGYLVATNRRLIFTGSSKSMMGNSLIVRETKIDQVSGVLSNLSRGKNIDQIIFGIILVLVGLVSLIVGDFGFFSLISLLIIAWGAHTLYKAFTLSGIQMYLSILTSGQSSSAIQVAVEAKSGILGRFGLGGDTAWLAVAASGPGKHTEQMIREIGALVQDIQVMGDLAIDKWVDQPMKNTPVKTPVSSEQLSSTLNKIKVTAAAASTAVSQQVQEKKAEYQNNANAKNSMQDDEQTCDCGNNIQSGSAFCGECGRPVKQKVLEESFFG
ncbi:hypothetical protein LC048_00275 [Mesobacillus subterraneus]|uniref:hypothetical protein n=1 Tax=Mesobacillus subterraneus TaxID=285983 RepID=UPI00273D54C3|nr:hypothetical protein [Mesobacillus subterraneus]WLR55499.1 hypothetical protein LC048_00275 [Mesobacillus subterraneus]